MSNFKPILGDIIIYKTKRGKVTKILPPKPPSPGGLVVENDFSIFFVAPWEKIEIVQQSLNI